MTHFLLLEVPLVWQVSATLLSKWTFPWALPGSQSPLPNKASEKGQQGAAREALGLEQKITFTSWELRMSCVTLASYFTSLELCFLICKLVWPRWPSSPVAWMPGFWGWYSQLQWTHVLWKTEQSSLQKIAGAETYCSTHAQRLCAVPRSISSGQVSKFLVHY